MIGLDAWARHAVGEFITATAPVTYNPISRPTGDFTSLLFKTRDDYIQPEVDMPNRFAVVGSNDSAVTIADGVNTYLTIDTELVDENGIVSLSSDTVINTPAGWYDFDAVVDVIANSGSALAGDGYFTLALENDGFSDNVYPQINTKTGETIDGVDYFVHGTFLTLDNGQTKLQFRNHTGASVDAYIVNMKITKL